MFRKEVTVDVSVVIRKDDLALLMQRPADDHNFPLHWGIPGGGFEVTDKTLEETAIRETKEEVGVKIKNLRLLGNNYDLDRNVIFVVYEADYDGGEIIIDPKEVAQAGWFGVGAFEDLVFTPLTEELLRKALV